MAGSRDLYDLIGTLSRTEKRYCTLMLEASPGRSASSCRRLFEILTSLPALDEPAVRAAVADETFAGHLAVTKNHLYEHLLRSLRAFGGTGAARAQIQARTEGAEVLMDRGLHAQAAARLREARTLAERYGILGEQLRIVWLEQHIDSRTGYVGIDREGLRKRRDRIDAILRDVVNYWDHIHAFALVSREVALNGTGTHGDESEEGAGETLGGLLERLPPPISLPARRLHADTLRLHYLLTARYEEGYEHSLGTLRFVESYPASDRIDYLNYASLLYNHLLMSVRTRRRDEAERTLDALGSLRLRGREPRALQARYLFCGRLALRVSELDPDAIAAMAPELEAICGKEENGITRQMRLGYAIDLAVAQIADGRLRQAACTLHPVINDHRPGFRNDLLCIARMLRLMIHYDLGDIELLPYLIRSTYRFIARCRGISELDRAVLGFLRRLPNLATRDDLLTAFIRARAELEAIASSPAEWEASGIGSILAWLEAKITGRTFGEVMREAVS